MIPVDRSRVSGSTDFDKPNPRTGKTELQRIIDHRAGPDRDKTFDFSVYKSAAAKAALDELFHGKCAYCESYYAKTQPVDVEHYRPKAEVEGVANHPGYWWLAMVWTNLLPSCIDCNRRREQHIPDALAPSLVQLAEAGDRNRWRKLSTGKASTFPLAQGSPRAASEADDCETEHRLLLDPTRDDPADHIGFYVDRNRLVSLVYPRPIDPDAAPVLPAPVGGATQVEAEAATSGVSAMGAVSIQIYGLNRLGLVQARTRVLRDLEFMLELSLGLEEIAIEIEGRLEKRKDQIERAPSDAVLEEIEFLTRIAGKVSSHRKLVRSHMGDALAPTSPYSALAKAWAQAFIEQG